MTGGRRETENESFFVFLGKIGRNASAYTSEYVYVVCKACSGVAGRA